MPRFDSHSPAVAILILASVLTACNGGSDSGSKSESSSNPETAAASSVPAPGNARKGASITLHWPIPQLREDGSILEIDEIAGYELTYKNSRRDLEVVTIDDGVYQVMGIANTHVIATPAGNVMFDTGLSIQA